MKTDNELIAEFMLLSRHPKEYHLFWVADYGYNCYVGKEMLLYNSSWDWLMPVVEKISKYVYESWEESNGYKEICKHDRAYPRTFGMIDNDGKWMVRINRMFLQQENTLIDATYKSVVEFIKWFNGHYETSTDI